MPSPRLLVVILTVLTLIGSAPALAQTPVPEASPGATPAPSREGFVLVAIIGADEWREPLPTVLPGVDLGDLSLLEALQEGGFVIYVRHGATDTAYDQNVDLTDCATQRNLSETGREQAKEIGAGFTALGIPVGEVRSSEFCRAAETAKLAFGKDMPDPMLTPLPEDTSAEQEAKAEALRELLSTPPEAGTNTVIVAHQHNIDPLGIDLDEGEAAVFLPVE